jgi:hypothetical protein
MKNVQRDCGAEVRQLAAESVREARESPAPLARASIEPCEVQIERGLIAPVSSSPEKQAVC